MYSFTISSGIYLIHALFTTLEKISTVRKKCTNISRFSSRKKQIFEAQFHAAGDEYIPAVGSEINFLILQ